MALSKVNFNSLNVTPAASKAIKFNSNNNGIETGDVGGSLVLLETQTASSSGTISFTSNIDSTYKEYQFHCTNIHPATDATALVFQSDTGTNTNYNQTITSTMFQAYHNEGGSDTTLSYRTDSDQAQGTAFQEICLDIGNDNDQCCNGILHIFEPSSTTFVKHFISRFARIGGANYAGDQFYAGYFNTTTAITRFQFKMASGNIDAGTFKLYGVS